MKRLFILTTAICLVSSSLWSLTVNLDPSRLDLKLKPGSGERRNLVVANNGEEAVEITMYLNDWFLKDGSRVFAPGGTTVYTLKDQVQLYPTRFKLEPGQTQPVLVNITAGKQETGGQYGVIFAEARPSANNRGSGLGLSGRIGCVVYKEIDGKSVTAYDIEGLSAALPEKGKVKVTFTLQNSGNILLRPVITALLLDSASNEVLDRTTIPPVQVLPGTKVPVVFPWTLESTANLNYRALNVLLTFDFGGNDVVLQEIKIK